MNVARRCGPTLGCGVRSGGYTLVEVLLVTVLSAMLIGAANELVTQANTLQAELKTRVAVQGDIEFAFQRLQLALSGDTQILLPLADKGDTAEDEGLREESVPASGSGGTAVLAVRLDRNIDRDQDGYADADNDQDGLVDEDLGSDMTNDYVNGIVGIDDDNDGSIDESFFGISTDDDERLFVSDEDKLNGVDDDGDGNVDEDVSGDMNDDNAPGIAGLDDDGDGTVDEGNDNDDDEDGSEDEDWIDAVVFYLDGGRLIERMPANWDVSGNGQVNGEDYLEAEIVENVTYFRVRRIDSGRATLVDITLQVLSDDGETLQMQTMYRVGTGR